MKKLNHWYYNEDHEFLYYYIRLDKNTVFQLNVFWDPSREEWGATLICLERYLDSCVIQLDKFWKKEDWKEVKDEALNLVNKHLNKQNGK